MDGGQKKISEKLCVARSFLYLRNMKATNTTNKVNQTFWKKRADRTNSDDLDEPIVTNYNQHSILASTDVLMRVYLRLYREGN